MTQPINRDLDYIFPMSIPNIPGPEPVPDVPDMGQPEEVPEEYYDEPEDGGEEEEFGALLSVQV